MELDLTEKQTNSSYVVLPSNLKKACLNTDASWEELKRYPPGNKRMAVIIEMDVKIRAENSEPRITSVLKDLDFEVTMCKKEDRTQENLPNFFENIKKEIKAGETECFILVLTGMSAEGKTIEFKTRDEKGNWADKTRNLSLWKDVMEQFNNDNCAELINVPKIFVLQLYGYSGDHEDGSKADAKTDLGPPHLPTWTDMLLCNSKIVGCHPFQNPSKKDPSKGASSQQDCAKESHFMEFLCDVLESRGRNTDIRTVLDIVSEMLKVQMEHDQRRGEGEKEFSQYYNIGFRKECWFPKK